MKRQPLLPLVMLALFSFEAKAGLSGSADAGYYSQERLPKNHIPKELDRDFEATVRLSQDLEPHCTGSLISSDGYVLTAGHCVSDCLREQGKVAESSDSILHYKLIRFPDQHPDVTCDRIRILERGAGNPQVVFVGKGFSEFDDGRLLDFPTPVFEQMISQQDDFAILKFEFPEKPIPCIPAAANPRLKSGDAVWAIGFPSATRRPDQLGSDGFSKYISFGTVYPDLSKNQYYLESHFSPQLLARAQAFYSNGNQILSNMDIVGGNSGSPVVNSQGDLVGVASAGAIGDPADAEARFLDGTAVTTSLDSILQELIQNLGKEKTSELFRCHP